MWPQGSDQCWGARQAVLPRKGQELAVRFLSLVAVLLVPLAAACTPTLRVEAPREPITINLNVRLDADVRVRLEERAREDIQANPGIF
jgi:hypothetical protein